MNEGRVLVVHVPGAAPVMDLRECRDYVADGLRAGLLVVGGGVTFSLLDLPELGCETGPEPEDGAAPAPRKSPGGKGKTWPQRRDAFKGAESKEKQRIFDRLERYLREKGHGSLAPLAAMTGGRFSQPRLVGILNNESLPDVEGWQVINRALDAIEAGAGDG